MVLVPWLVITNLFAKTILVEALTQALTLEASPRWWVRVEGSGKASPVGFENPFLSASPIILAPAPKKPNGTSGSGVLLCERRQLPHNPGPWASFLEGRQEGRKKGKPLQKTPGCDQSFTSLIANTRVSNLEINANTGAQTSISLTWNLSNDYTS